MTRDRWLFAVAVWAGFGLLCLLSGCGPSQMRPTWPAVLFAAAGLRYQRAKSLTAPSTGLSSGERESTERPQKGPPELEATAGRFGSGSQVR
jgi:hypothetical protein